MGLSTNQACELPHVLDNLAVGEREATILSEYPSLTRANIRAALAFAADLAHDRILPIPA